MKRVDLGDGGTELADIVGPCWTAARTATALGIDPTELPQWCERGDLLMVQTSDGNPLYPVFQFRSIEEGTVEVSPALSRVIRALVGHASWAVAVLMVTPASELDGLTPLDWARQRRPHEALTRYGEQVAKEWA